MNILGTSLNDTLVGSNSDDVFIGDPQRKAETYTLSQPSGGPALNGTSSYGSIDFATGRELFMSQASNLVEDDTNFEWDVFLRDADTGVVTRLSTSATGQQGNGRSELPVFSTDGSKVFFLSTASNLVVGDSNGFEDLFMKDLATGAITRVSTSSSGAEANNDVYTFDVSPDGTKVVFASQASTLVAGDNNGARDIFLKDLVTGVTTRISTDSNGADDGHYYLNPSFSKNGTEVIYEGFGKIYAKDLVTGARTEVSTNAAGGGADSTSDEPKVAKNGDLVLFSSFATNLVAGVPGGGFQVYLKDRTSGSIQLISTDASGNALPNRNYNANISEDGRYITFWNLNTNVPPPDPAIFTVYLKDMLLGTTSVFAQFPWDGLNGVSVNSISSEFGLVFFDLLSPVKPVQQSYAYSIPDLGAGRDSMDGGDGFDVASYYTALSGLTINRTDNTGNSNTGDALGDTYTSIEGFGLSTFVDSFIGSNADETVAGREGADILNGGGNTLAGDTLRYASSEQGVTVNLGTSTASGGEAEGDVISNFENVQGSDGGDDALTGSGGVNVLRGMAGNDRLAGGASADHLDGGIGNDTADYSASSSGQVYVSLLADTATGGEAQGDTLDDIENLTGSNTLRDILIGNNDANILRGNGGNDSLRGEGGNDYLEGGAGADSLNAGAGESDWAGYRSSTIGIVNISLLANTATGGEATGDLLFFVENLEGSLTQRDILIGNDMANIIVGNGGLDSIRGEGGNDLINGGVGADSLNGGSGLDTVSYATSLASVTVDLKLVAQIGGDAQGDSLFFFENVIGSDYDDVLSGGITGNRLSGGLGLDTLNGREGSDYLTGGGAADTFRFDVSALGVDTITDWEDGTDHISMGSLVESSFAGLSFSGQGTTRVVIRGLNGTGAIAVESAQAFSLDASDFLFV